MRRRDFLYNTGLLLPALLASPSAVLASQKTINTEVLIIPANTFSLQAVIAACNELSVQEHQLTGTQISRLEYSPAGFRVTTNDQQLLLAQKIIIYAGCQVNVSRSSMEINTGHKTFHLNYVSTDQDKPVPEFWFLKTQQFLANKTKHFINRDQHVVLCLSDT